MRSDRILITCLSVGAAVAVALALLWVSYGRRPVAAAAPATRPAWDDDDILEVVLRDQMARYPRDARGRANRPPVGHYFIHVGATEAGPLDPPPQFLARFAGHNPPVGPASAADMADRYLRHKTTGGRGVVFGAGGVRYTGRDTAEAEGELTDVSGGPGYTYQLTRVEGKWVVTGRGGLSINCRFPHLGVAPQPAETPVR